MIRSCGNLLRLARRKPHWTLLVVGALIVAGVLGIPYLRAVYHFRRARTADERHQLAEAQRHLEICLQLWPQSAPVHFLAARVARRSGARDEAARHLRECERLEGTRSEAVSLESLLLEAEASELSPDLERSLVERSERDPQTAPLIREALACGYLEARRLPSALRCLDQVVEAQADNARAFYLRGQVRDRMSRLDALDDYRRALQLDPENDRARLALAEALLTFGQVDAAASEFAVLRERDPSNPVVRLGLADCPHNAGALRERGRVALEAGEGGDAEHWLRLALTEDPSDRDANHLLGQALRQQGKEDEAREQEATSAQVQTDLMRMGEILNQELGRRPHDPALRCELGRLCLRYRQDRQALHWLLSAVQQDARYAPAHAALAQYYERTGDQEAARQHQLMAGDRATGKEKAP
jgi:Tfp pilus assembly protein PilF